MIRENTDLLIIIPPLGIKHTVYPPYGSMCIASALRQKGYKPKILNVDVERITNDEVIERIRRINPEYIGFSGIVAVSYKYIKELSLEIRKAFPAKIQILGGGLSSAAEVILRNTSIDVVVCGEGDITIVELINCLKNNNDLSAIRGIYYKKGSSSVFTGRRRLIGKLDILPYPAFDLVEMDRYLPDGVEFIRNFTTKIVDKKMRDRKRRRKMVTISTSRGCFNECSFCFRSYPGLRLHSMKYVFDFIEYCVKRFDAGFFTFGDECFAPNKDRNWEFIREYKRRGLDIIFRILGMRVDTVDPDILRAHKEIGCWMIEYGFESGSQKMLNIINKRVTVGQNRNAALWTHEAGIYTSPALVLAMPGETSGTIRETIDFLKSLNFDFKQYQWKYAIPIPGAQLYNFAEITGAIKDEDEYLSSLAGEAGSGDFNINLTDEPDEVVAGWAQQLKDALDEHYMYGKRKIRNRLIAQLANFLSLIDLHCRRKTLLPTVRKKIKSFFCSIFVVKNKADIQRKNIQFKKKKDINVEELIKGADHSSVNTKISLKKINEKLKIEKMAIK